VLVEISQAAYLMLLFIFLPIPFATDRRISSRPLFTYGLIAINIVIYFVWIFPSAGTSHQNDIFAVWGVIPRVPSFLSLFTSLFLHVSITHLLWNMAFLWLFGPSCEDALGHGPFIVFYITGGVAAGLLHTAIVLLFAENSGVAFAPLVGASGAISAVVGMYSLRFYRSKLRMVWLCATFLKLKTARFEIPAIAGLTLWLLQNLFGAIYALFQPDRNGIAYWAHIGGFLFGMTVAEITGMLGEGMREYLFADAVTAQSRGEDGVQEAVANFRLLLQRQPDDSAVRESLAMIATNSESMDSVAVQRSVGEAYAMMLEQALASGDISRVAEWQKAFDALQAHKLIGSAALASLAGSACRLHQPILAERLFRQIIERFPGSLEARASELEIAALLLDAVDTQALSTQALVPLLGLGKLAALPTPAVRHHSVWANMIGKNGTRRG
jgi:membrane associated rhomboid family serine protease